MTLAEDCAVAERFAFVLSAEFHQTKHTNLVSVCVPDFGEPSFDSIRESVVVDEREGPASLSRGILGLSWSCDGEDMMVGD